MFIFGASIQKVPIVKKHLQCSHVGAESLLSR